MKNLNNENDVRIMSGRLLDPYFFLSAIGEAHC